MSDPVADSARGGASAHLEEWAQYFRAGGVFTAPVDQELLARRLKGNQAGLLLTIISIVVVVAGTVDALNRGSVPVVLTIMLGIVALTLALGVWRLWTTRQRLHTARVSPKYLTISQSGVRIADVIELPWALSIGVVVLTGDSGAGSGKQRLGAAAARGSGIAQTELIIGLGPGVAKPLRAAAGKRLRRLFEVIGEGGALRVPLDSVLSPTSTAQVIAAAQAAGKLAGVGAVGPEDLSAATTAVQELYLGKPIPAAARADHTRAMTAAAVASTAAASVASSPHAVVAVMFGRALAAASTAGLAPKGAAIVAQDPVGAPSSAAPADQDSPPAASLSIDELANAVLGSAGRELFDDARRYLEANGPDAFAARFPDMDNAVSGDGPTDIQLLLSAGLSPHARTIGWCDWSGEDDPGQVLDFVEQSCRTLWQSVPFWPAATVAGGDPVVSALHRADEGLSRAGQRLLLIDDDSDTYNFVPVKQSVFAALVNRAGDGFRLVGVDRL